MDGNNRFSKKNNLNKFQAYSAGAKNLIELSDKIFNKTNINYITAFALSRHNLKRPKKIIDIILKILNEYVDRSLIEKRNFSIEFRGDLSFLNIDIIKKIKLLEKKNKSFDKKLIILLNYSGKQDIVESFIKIKSKNISINADNIYKNLTLFDIPDPDMILRTGGFQRVSDFLLFNISFTELFFSKKLWPEFKYNDFSKYIEKYKKTERKFGI